MRITSLWSSSSLGTKPLPPHVGHCCSSSVRMAWIDRARTRTRSRCSDPHHNRGREDRRATPRSGVEWRLARDSRYATSVPAAARAPRAATREAGPATHDATSGAVTAASAVADRRAIAGEAAAFTGAVKPQRVQVNAAPSARTIRQRAERRLLASVPAIDRTAMGSQRRSDRHRKRWQSVEAPAVRKFLNGCPRARRAGAGRSAGHGCCAPADRAGLQVGHIT